MKRLPEEKELRRVIKLYSPHDGRINRLITAFKKALQEDERKRIIGRENA